MRSIGFALPALALVAISSADAQHPSANAATRAIVIARPVSQPPSAGSDEHFTGTVRVERLYDASAPARGTGSNVIFERGARTFWHTHPLGQTLVVTAGVGRVQMWGGPVEQIRAGDVVWIPPGVKHWHGASPDSSMSHIGIVERLDGRSVDWLEPVTDAQYRAVVRTSPPTDTRAQPARDSAAPSRAQSLFGDFAPEMADLTDRVLYGEVWARPQLSQRDRSLVTVSALIAMHRPDQLRSHIARARGNGVTREEMAEIITQLAFYAGWPNAVTAVGVAREVYVPK